MAQIILKMAVFHAKCSIWLVLSSYWNLPKSLAQSIVEKYFEFPCEFNTPEMMGIVKLLICENPLKLSTSCLKHQVSLEQLI
jgi:hypothetical protein